MDRTTQPLNRLTRRRFVQAAAGLGITVAGLELVSGCGATSLPSLSLRGGSTLETTKLKVSQQTGICQAAQYVAEDLFRAEGFTDLQYVPSQGSLITDLLASGEVDIGMQFSGPLMIRVDAGDPIVALAGIHVGCFEMFGSDKVRAIRDLKGKDVAIIQIGGPEHVFLSSMAAYVGLDPTKDINWVTLPAVDGKQLLADGK